jgi:hypothetical protein
MFKDAKIFYKNIPPFLFNYHIDEEILENFRYIEKIQKVGHITQRDYPR